MKRLDLNPKTCRFLKKCKEGYIRNLETRRCKKIKKIKVKKTEKINRPVNIPRPPSNNVNRPVNIPRPPSNNVNLPNSKIELNNIEIKNDNKLNKGSENMIMKEEIENQEQNFLSILYKQKVENEKTKTKSHPENLTPEKLHKTISKSLNEEKIEMQNNLSSIEKYIRVFPSDSELIRQANKSYLVFNNGGTGIMLAENIYDKDGQIRKLMKNDLLRHKQPPVGWYASEKYDGVRTIWTGKELIARPTKTGGQLKSKVFSYVPEWFISLLPPGISLDGELWLGRGNFDKVSGISNLIPTGKKNKEQIEELWKNIKYMVFDIPSSKKVFIERTDELKDLVDTINLKYGAECPIVYSNNIYIENEDKLIELYKDFTSNGAEGIILREPNSLYEFKRSKFLLKMKIHEDAEAIVIDYVMGTGRLSGMLGSLKCKLKNNKIFYIGTGFNDKARTEYNDPESLHFIPINSIVNFSYMELTKEGIPRHPVFRGIRTDVTI